MPNPAILPLWSLSTCPLVLTHPTDHNHAGFSPRTALHHPHATPCRPYDHHNVKPYPGPLLSTAPCHIALTLHAEHTRHRPRSNGRRQNPSRIVITTHRHARACTGMPRYASERRLDPSPPSSSHFLLSPAASPHHQLALGHDHWPALDRSPSPSSPSFRHGTAETTTSPARPSPSLAAPARSLASPRRRRPHAQPPLPLRRPETPRHGRPDAHPRRPPRPYKRRPPRDEFLTQPCSPPSPRSPRPLAAPH